MLIITRLVASRWMSSNQIWGSSEYFASFASLSATALQQRFTWEKDACRNLETSDHDSSTMCPNKAKQVELVVICLNTTSKSPSKITSCSLISCAKVIDFLQASASRSSTNGGKGTRSDNAAITIPSKYLMTTPNLAQLTSGKIAPSQLAKPVSRVSSFR